MSAPITSPRPAPPAAKAPALCNGDRLTAEEFDWRYGTTPEGFRAELIEGVVYVDLPLNAEDHGEPHFDVIGWLSIYQRATPGIRGGDNSTLRLDSGNRPQPDAYLRILPTHGGMARTEEGYVVGGVELIFEIAASSAGRDLHDKLTAYERNGVREYVVWRTEDGRVDWFVLRAGRYEALSPGPDGIVRSVTLPGLWLDAAALVQGDAMRVEDVVRLGLASAEHAAFVAELRRRAGPPP